MSKAVKQESRASQLRRAHRRQQADEMRERLRFAADALEFYGHTYIRRVVLDAQVLIRILTNEL